MYACINLCSATFRFATDIATWIWDYRHKGLYFRIPRNGVSLESNCAGKWFDSFVLTYFCNYSFLQWFSQTLISWCPGRNISIKFCQFCAQCALAPCTQGQQQLQYWLTHPCACKMTSTTCVIREWWVNDSKCICHSTLNHPKIDCLLNSLIRLSPKKQQSTALLTFVWEIHLRPVIYLVLKFVDVHWPPLNTG